MLTDPQLVRQFPAFYETHRFITMLTTACRLSISWAWSIQCMAPHLLLMVFFHLCPSFLWSLFASGFPQKPYMHPLLSPTHATGTLFDVYLTSDMFWFNNHPQRWYGRYWNLPVTVLWHLRMAIKLKQVISERRHLWKMYLVGFAILLPAFMLYWSQN